MGEFFKGWRRRVGCVTLVMACVFMGGWMRSLYSYDSLELRFQRLNASLSLSSSPGRVSVGIATGKHPPGYFTFHARTVQKVDEEEQKTNETEHSVHSESDSEAEPEDGPSYLFGIVDIGTYGGGSGDFPMTINYGGTCIGTHYAVVVIPCALLSTWLFLSKQRKPLAKSPAINDK